jgi:hypothetical protein
MILRCEIKLKLGDAWTTYDRAGLADSLIENIRNLLNQDCEKSKGEMELLSIQGEIDPNNKGGAPHWSSERK